MRSGNLSGKGGGLFSVRSINDAIGCIIYTNISSGSKPVDGFFSDLCRSAEISLSPPAAAMKRRLDGSPVRRYNLAYYDAPPTGEITADVLQELGIARMNLLREVQKIKGSKLSFSEECKAMRSLTDGLGSLDTEKGGRRDRIAHFLARAICCSHEGLRGWFERNEGSLFYHRLLRENALEMVLGETPEALPLSPQEFDAWKADLYAVDESNGCGTFSKAAGGSRRSSGHRDYVKVPFERALSLVGSRKVLMRLGHAVVHRDRLNPVLTQGFRESLSEGTEVAALNWYRMKEALPREYGMLAGSRDRFLSELGDRLYRRVEAPRSGRLPLKDLAATARDHFPLCMQRLYASLVSGKHHLKYDGRFRLATFLKAAGLSLEEATEFWRAEFAKGGVSPERFRREYQYQLEHVYGKVGGGVIKYHPTGCDKMIRNKCNVEDFCGCPLSTVHDSPEVIRGALVRDGLGAPDVEDLMEHVGRGCAKTACRRYLEVRTGTKTTLEGMGNPNQYLALSLEAGAKGRARTKGGSKIVRR